MKMGGASFCRCRTGRGVWAGPHSHLCWVLAMSLLSTYRHDSCHPHNLPMRQVPWLSPLQRIKLKLREGRELPDNLVSGDSGALSRALPCWWSLLVRWHASLGPLGSRLLQNKSSLKTSFCIWPFQEVCVCVCLKIKQLPRKPSNNINVPNTSKNIYWVSCVASTALSSLHNYLI